MSFAVHKLETFSSNPGKVHFEVLVGLLRYIRENKTPGLKNDYKKKNAPLSDLLRQANINTENKVMFLSDYSWQYCSYTGRNTGSFIIFYQGGSIDHGTYVPGPVSQSSAEN